MKIGILSDVHLYHKNSQPQLFKKLIEDLQTQVDIIVDCGDLLDNNVINATQSYELKQIFENINIPYHIVMGNHDSLGGVSLASLLSMNSNIIVHNTVDFAYIDKEKLWLLFVPYTNNIKNLIKHLNSTIKEPVKYVFSHLNITNNIYADIPIKKTEKLFKYGDVWFNGHIHQQEEYHFLFGSFYNIGSVSSLTFGDSHIPRYLILDTEKQEDYLTVHEIKNSIIHITITDINNLSFLSEYENSEFKINWRILLPNNFYVEERQNIKEKLSKLDCTNNIVFSYTKINLNETKNIKKSIKSNETKKPLIQQLIEQYTKDNVLNEKIIKKLTEKGEL